MDRCGTRAHRARSVPTSPPSTLRPPAFRRALGLPALLLLLSPLARALPGQVAPDSLAAAREAAAAARPAPALPVRFAPLLPPVSLALPRPPAFEPFGRLAPVRLTGAFVAGRLADSLRVRLERRREAAWAAIVARALTPGGGPTLAAAEAAARADSARAAGGGDQFAALGLELNARLEAKGERNFNESCTATQRASAFSGCGGSLQPSFDFQFNVKSGGTVADRFHVDVDYDSQREFEASNNISVYYDGRPDELVHRIEIGNVSFAPLPSRFITSGIPSGNYGVQAIGQIGPMRFRTIVAQQKGNVVRDQLYTVGDRSVQQVRRDVEDYQVEARRFFFTVDPRQLSAWPNVDILDRRQLAALAAELPDSVRPTRVYLYRLLIGGQPANPNGPRFVVRGLASSARGPIYEYLREGVDYYVDPSNLWVALVRPLNVNNERLVVAYRIRDAAGRDTINANTGGTPDIEFRGDAVAQYANLLYDPTVRPTDSAFVREIRSVYRIGGEDVQRQTVDVAVVTGSGGDQEKPVAPGPEAFQTYLQMLGLAQSTNPAAFDVENRIFPRPSDPNFNVGAAGTDARTIRDYFLVFPSLRPFSDSGLVVPGNPSNAAIYTTPGEYLYSPQHPQSLYRIRVGYASQGGGAAGTLSLGAVQLRRGSERLAVDGIPLRRDVDYSIDYELGQVTFNRPDTLFPRARQVTAQYEENPVFAAAPTSILGLAAEFPSEYGTLGFTAISQSQRTTFNRPPLGLEPASATIAGVNGSFSFDAAPLTRALQALPFVRTSAPSRLSIAGEFATSRPQPNAAGQAYVESFEGEGGIAVPLDDQSWYYSSRPSLGAVVLSRYGAGVFDTAQAATLTWQTSIRNEANQLVEIRLADIDPQVRLSGALSAPERLLWLELFPRSLGGLTGGALTDAEGRRQRWETPPAGATGSRRWRSIRTVLSPSGVDLTRVEQVEFWALVDTSQTGRRRNPTLVLDFGDEISENSLVFQPQTLRAEANGDTTFLGRRLAGFDTLNTERDPFSRTFNATVNDVGLPGDRAGRIDPAAGGEPARDVALCRGLPRSALQRRDTRANCTVANSRLDEEDIDEDNTLGERESLRRYVVDLSDPARFVRVGDSLRFDAPDRPPTFKHWVLVRLPFSAPDDSVGEPLVRRTRALRLTMLSAQETPAEAEEYVGEFALARLRLVGAPWLKRTDRVISGAGGDSTALANGFVIASVIGTDDLDTLRGVFYQSPPGVEEQREQTGTAQIEQVQVNERSLRVLTGDLPLYHRAEAYFRFPEGQKSFMGYRELRLWGRGRGRGWGEQGELQMFVKLGRDANNFYLYRTPVNAGDTRAAWLPEVRVDFDRFYQLRARLQNAFLQQSADSIACTGLDAELVRRSGVPTGTVVNRYAACEDGYIVYTIDPATAPPNLAAVQELAVGIVRVAEGGAGGGTPIVPSDTLELWVDDIRLTSVESTPGYAGQLAVGLVAADVADLRISVSRRDPYFRQLAEQPSFITDDALDVATSVRLEKLLPAALGIALPLTVAHSSTAQDPLFLTRSDLAGDGVRGLRTPRASSTRYAVAMRRVAPLAGWSGVLLNPLSLTGTFNTGSTRGEYQREENEGWTAAAEYLLQAAPRAFRAPRWFGRVVESLPGWLGESDAARSLREAALRWSPTQVRLTSTVVRSENRRLTFLKPAEAPDDVPRRLDGLVERWRNGAAIELRPFAALGARVDFSSVRDLRDFRDPTRNDSVARRERGRLFGEDIGLERERGLATALNFTPPVASWLRPRFDLGTSYTLLRDPDAPALVQTGETGGEFRLPRRLSISRVISTGGTFEPGRAILVAFGQGAFVRRLAGVFAPVDATWSQNLLAAFDGTPFTPPARFQLGLGDDIDLRRVNGRLATSAGRQRAIAVNSALNLPLGAQLVGRFTRTASRNWTQRTSNDVLQVDNVQRTFPDLSLRWTFRPALLASVLSSVGVNAGMRWTEGETVTPGAVGGGPTEVSRAETRSYPLNASAAWAAGGLSTAVGYTLTEREDDRPGSVGDGSTRDLAVDVGRSFRPPSSWDLRGDIRTRLSLQRSRSQSFVFNSATGGRSALADNGRDAISLNADTDVSPTMNFSLQGSRVVSFDRNFDRRFTQTVVTAVLQIQFFAGDRR
ncbi:MAG TPA: cell surface protein SprA [Gemmatimonadaceae bacterium]|nr:cell surface protein SprA [Gemmatimonadaceae bacterium]